MTGSAPTALSARWARCERGRRSCEPSLQDWTRSCRAAQVETEERGAAAAALAAGSLYSRLLEEPKESPVQ